MKWTVERHEKVELGLGTGLDLLFTFLAPVPVLSLISPIVMGIWFTDVLGLYTPMLLLGVPLAMPLVMRHYNRSRSHFFFAWLPTRIDGKMVWLELLLRKVTIHDNWGGRTKVWSYDYIEKPLPREQQLENRVQELEEQLERG